MPDGSDRPLALVTGGAGFIGSHLCERLLARGWRVICLDDLSSGRSANMEPLRASPWFDFRHGDVCTPFDIPCQRIFHLACPASPAFYRRRPLETLKTGVLGTLNVLENALRHEARLLLASTSEVYGDPEVHPQHESYTGCVDPTGPRACYDEAKRCAETFATEFHRQKGLSVRIARIFNTYGPRMRPDDGRVVSNLVVQALRGEPLTVYGDGSQTRSLCYVDDLVDGLLTLMDSAEVGAAPVNLGNPEEITVLDLARQILALSGSPSRFAFLPLPQDDPRRRRPDIGRAGHILRWRPRISLADGLPTVIRHFRQQVETDSNPTHKEAPCVLQ